MSNIANAPRQGVGKLVPFIQLNPQSIIQKRAPLTTDNAEISTIWVQPVSATNAAVNAAWILTSKINGVNNWANITGGSASFQNIALPYTTATVGRITHGGINSISVPETTSIFLGQAAGNVTYTGNHEVGVGQLALSSLTSGIGNTAVGYEAGQNITTGAGNTLVGSTAGNALISGSSNVGIGGGTFAALTTGSNNIAIGLGAGNTITTTSNNVYINDPGVLGDASMMRITSSGAAVISTTGSTNSLELKTNGLVQVDAVFVNAASPTATVTANQRVIAASFTGFTTAAAAFQSFTINSNIIVLGSHIQVTVGNSNVSTNGALMAIYGITYAVGGIIVRCVNNGAGALGAGDTVYINVWILD